MRYRFSMTSLFLVFLYIFLFYRKCQSTQLSLKLKFCSNYYVYIFIFVMHFFYLYLLITNHSILIGCLNGTKYFAMIPFDRDSILVSSLTFASTDKRVYRWIWYIRELSNIIKRCMCVSNHAIYLEWPVSVLYFDHYALPQKQNFFRKMENYVSHRTF